MSRLAPTLLPSTSSRLNPQTLHAALSLLRASSTTPRDFAFLALLLATIALYVLLGYRLVLAPGTLYSALVADDRPAFLANFLSYTLLASSVLALKVLRATLREAAALALRARLGTALHTAYVADGTADGVPGYYFLAKGGGRAVVDNPDQRAAGDVAAFARATFNVLCGEIDTGGVVEAVGSIVWYTVKVADRTGWYGVGAAYAWSALVAFVTVAAVNDVAPVVFEQERLDARLRSGHVALREGSEEVAFLRGGRREREVLDRRLGDAVRNGWVLVRRHVALNAVQYGFGYFVSLVMYAAIGFSIFSDVMSSSSSSYSADMEPGDKAKWISQTGGVFIQLLYSFTTVIQLGTVATELVASTTRLAQLLDTLEAHRVIESRGAGLRRRDDLVRAQEKEALLAVADGLAKKVDVGDSDELYARDLVVQAEGGGGTIGPISFAVVPGKWVMLDGKSGSGKSSILRAMRGLWDPVRGRKNLPRDRSGSGPVFFSPQQPYIADEMSLRELVMYPSTPVGGVSEAADVSGALEAVGWARGVGGRIMDDECASWAEWLSPGEKQVVCAARVVFHRPRFAILDEPTSAMDSVLEKKVLDALRGVGIGAVVVGHTAQMRSQCDEIVAVG